MEKATEMFAAVFLSVIGISHVVQPQAWVEYFVWLRGKGRAGAFVNGLMSLAFGSLIVGFHNVWHGLPVLLTVLGWAQVLKGLMSLIAPQVALWSLARVSPERAWQFIAGGTLAVVLSGMLWYSAFTR